jgi:hypothetical protein
MPVKSSCGTSSRRVPPARKQSGVVEEPLETLGGALRFVRILAVQQRRPANGAVIDRDDFGLV